MHSPGISTGTVQSNKVRFLSRKVSNPGCSSVIGRENIKTNNFKKRKEKKTKTKHMEEKRDRFQQNQTEIQVGLAEGMESIL